MPFTVPVEYVPARYRCCSCFHVRTGTFLLAVLQIVIHFVVITILTAALGRAAHFREDVEYVALSISVMSFIQWERFVGTPERLGVVPKEPSTPDRTQHLPLENRATEAMPSATKRPYVRTGKFFINAGEEYVAIAVTLLSLLFSIMMLVGTIYAKPYYLLPYCCVQFVDLFVTCLSVVGYYTYLPESSTWARSQLVLSLVVILAGILLLAVKAYMLAMVWLCYKFLLRFTTGREPVSGFSLAAGSCCLPLSLCERMGCVRYASAESCTLTPSVLAQDGRIPPVNVSQSQTGTGRIIVLFRGSRGPANSPARIGPAELCLPPKYEDVLAMPRDAFEPPPYELLSGEHVICDIQDHETQPQSPNTTNERPGDSYSQPALPAQPQTVPPDDTIPQPDFRRIP
ncbi:phosphatidylinositol 3-kinase [Clonorchis sinensis]|uniref:Phosphatidylinositol 3-kinase n=1 Tax=Clonorchis sinensis TaxID=79923 RepID=A0A419QFP8_CLOSI|nr:phosphatidylinositol 3-kinase [Clonorchis sinensis]